MDKIPYFDAHCDTISRCVETGEGFTGEDREFYAVPCSLRRSEGHIDLERTERAFSRYAQFFAFYRDGRGLTQRQLLTACARQHERFLRELEENKDRIRLCRTGEEIDRAAADGVAVVVDRMSVPYLNGAMIDFVDSIEKQGFTIDNPNATGSCACGDSFN